MKRKAPWQALSGTYFGIIIAIAVLLLVFMFGMGVNDPTCLECNKYPAPILTQSPLNLQPFEGLRTTSDLESFDMLGGRLTKLGVMDYRYAPIFSGYQRHWSNRSSLQPHALWKDEIYNKHTQESDLLATLGPPSKEMDFLQCDIFVNHKYKLLYVRLPKCGSSTILYHFGYCGKPGANPDTCWTELTAGIPPAELEAMWREYVVFSVVRNPFSRAVSIYNYLTERKGSCRDVPSWGAFCRDTLTVPKFCSRRTECCKGDTGHFPRFVYYRHTLPQAQCLTTPSGQWAVDYLLRVEHLEEDLKAFIAFVNAGRDEGGAQRQAEAQRWTRWESLSKAVRGRGGWAAAVSSHAESTGGKEGGPPPPLPSRLGEFKALKKTNARRHASFTEFFKDANQQCIAEVQRAYPYDFALLVNPTTPQER